MSFTDIREKEKEERRRVILEAAEKLFFSKGFDNVSMGDIAQEVGVNRATLYLYFKDKESIFFAIVLRSIRIMRDMFREGVARETTGIRKIEATGRAFFNFYRQYPDYCRLFHYSGSDRFDATCCEDAREIMALNQEIMMTMVDSIIIGMKDGTIRSDLNPLEVAVFLSTASQSVISLQPGFRAALQSQGIGFEEYVEHSLDFMRHAMISSRKEQEK
ncbi:TetR/AcrR family transcriptional regulator [Methanocella sp. MCL-LM]|uniref:TetR/AcrR family transcriptional regulator n=1 Tax=Methanocella sp. MCL-LM TaxID=3412035 RepID=UPI003C725327